MFFNNQKFCYDEILLTSTMGLHFNEHESINVQKLNLPLINNSRTLIFPYSNPFGDKTSVRN